MRLRGKLTSWNGERGIGYITPSAGAKQVIVRFSEFKNKRNPPEVGQLVAFELTTDVVGRPCAEQVVREGEVVRMDRRRRRGERQSSFIKAAVVFALVVLGCFGIIKYQQSGDASPALAETATAASSAPRQ